MVIQIKLLTKYLIHFHYPNSLQHKSPRDANFIRYIILYYIIGDKLMSDRIYQYKNLISVPYHTKFNSFSLSKLEKYNSPSHCEMSNDTINSGELLMSDRIYQ